MPPKAPINSKKAKLYNSRTIRAETADANFRAGMLSVPEFLASREFEIKSFELSQLNTKYASSTRVFQSLPRSLRRRAASHNVKRIPKRLRNRALREMQNSANGEPPKKKHARGRELYRLKMSKRLLTLASKIKLMRALPVGLERHAKIKDHMRTLDSQIKELSQQNLAHRVLLNNSVGAYDNTGSNELASKPRGNIKYSKRQKEFVWTPSHVWHAKRFHLVKRWGFQIPYRPTQKCFRLMNRLSKTGSVIYETSYMGAMVVKTSSPQAFEKVLLAITKYKYTLPQGFREGRNSYDSWLYQDGVKAGVGMVYAVEPLHKILIRVHPSLYETYFGYVKGLLAQQEGKNILFDCRYSLGSFEIHGPTSLNSLSKIFHLNSEACGKDVCKEWIVLSKLQDSDLLPTGTTFCFSIKDPRFWKHPVNPPPAERLGSIYQAIVSRPKTVSSAAVSQLLDPEQRNESYREMYSIKRLGSEFAKVRPSQNYIAGNAVPIPIMVTKLKSGNWAVTLPWYWLVPVWSKLIQIKNSKFGGLRQLHQINFENGKPSFPTDFPFLKEGWAENAFKTKVSEEKFGKLSRSHRPPYDKFEGEISPFGCDWTYLQKLVFGLKLLEVEGSVNNKAGFGSFNDAMQRKIKSVNDVLLLIRQYKQNQSESHKREPVLALLNKTDDFHRLFVEGLFNIDPNAKFPALPVIQAKFTSASSGNIQDGARVYAHTGQRGAFDVPVESLVGFVSSGTYNLNMGLETGIGCLRADYSGKRVFIRNIGCSTLSVATVQKL